MEAPKSRISPKMAEYLQEYEAEIIPLVEAGSQCVLITFGSLFSLWRKLKDKHERPASIQSCSLEEAERLRGPNCQYIKAYKDCPNHETFILMIGSPLPSILQHHQKHTGVFICGMALVNRSH